MDIQPFWASQSVAASMYINRLRFNLSFFSVWWYLTSGNDPQLASIEHTTHSVRIPQYSAIYCVLQLKWPGTLFILNISLLYKTRLQIMFNLLWFCHLCAYEWRHLFHRQHPLLISILFLKSFQSILHPLLSVYFLECQLHYV